MKLMNKLFVFLTLFVSSTASSQLVVNVMMPASGLVQKQQLWNILITNTANSVVHLQIQTSLHELATGRPVLSAATGVIVLNPGTTQLTAASVGQVQYNVLSSDYRIDPGPVGLLPVGSFNVCYNFVGEGAKLVLQDCQSLNIQPLTPLLLNMPANGSTLDHVNPTFYWLPLSSAQLLTNLTYVMNLVEVFPGQTPADATQRNIPVFATRNLSSANLAYGHNAPALVKGKEYAWQVIAMNNITEIIRSESWSFKVADKADAKGSKAGNVYVKLRKEGDAGGYTIFYGSLRFEYFNETSDTTWNVELVDFNAGNAGKIHIAHLDTLKMSRGENLVDISKEMAVGLRDRHIYSLSLRNSRGEIWMLKFEYRKEDQ